MLALIPISQSVLKILENHENAVLCFEYFLKTLIQSGCKPFLSEFQSTSQSLTTKIKNLASVSDQNLLNLTVREFKQNILGSQHSKFLISSCDDGFFICPQLSFLRHLPLSPIHLLFYSGNLDKPEMYWDLDQQHQAKPINPSFLKDYVDAYKSYGYIFEANALSSIEETLSLKDFLARSRSQVYTGTVLPGIHLHESLLNQPTDLKTLMDYRLTPPKPCLFLDRDGILITDTHYPHKISECHIIPEIIPIIQWAKNHSWRVIIISNQAGLAKEKFSAEDFEVFDQHLRKEMQRLKAGPDAWYYCPYHPEGSSLQYRKQSLQRKPKPGMMLQASRDFSIDLHKSIMIGDKASDVIELEGPEYLLVQGQYSTANQNAKIFSNLGEVFTYLKKRTHS